MRWLREVCIAIFFNSNSRNLDITTPYDVDNEYLFKILLTKAGCIVSRQETKHATRETNYEI